MMKNIQHQIDISKENLRLAITHLKYSYQKVKNIKFETTDIEELETLEAFSSRFSRVSDIFLKQLLRSLVLQKDPAFQGGLRDYVNEGEKFSFLSSAERWMSIRELRNREAYEYMKKSIAGFFQAINDETPFLIEEIEKIL